MAMLCTRRLAVGAIALTGVAGIAGCIDPFHGSNIQTDFYGADFPSETDGETPGSQPWADTYFTFYAIDNVYELDEDGLPLRDDDGEKIVTQSFVFEVDRFEIHRSVNINSPCFIELEGAPSRFPGLHSTQFYNKLREVTGIDDPFAPPAGASDGDIIDLLTAQVRMSNMSQLQGQVRAVTSSSPLRYPEPGTECVVDGGPDDLIPPPTCIDDESSAVRLAVCQEIWAQDPNFYEGNDKVLTLPLNGKWRGAVDGPNPINEGFVGGASFFTDKVLTNLDAMTVNWQFYDRDEDGEPDYPADFPDEEKSPRGVIYLRGDSEIDTRGVISVPMFNPEEPVIRAEATVFPHLGDDDVHF